MRLRLLAALLASSTIAACGGGSDDGGPVGPVPVAEIAFVNAPPSLVVGGTAQLAVVLRDASGNALVDRGVAWTSSDESRARVSATGVVTGVSAGPVTVTAASGGRTVQAQLVVQPAPPASVVVALVAPSIGVGESTQASATAYDASGAPLAGGTVSWSASAASVATVDASGRVTAVAVGSTQITAAVTTPSGVRTGFATLTVTAAPALADTVFMPGDFFSPPSLTIRRGGTVWFDFPAREHNVIFDGRAGAPADIQVTSRRVVPRTFTTAGTFPYDCRLHPGMVGEIVVR